jgi:hypothetical protein
MEIDAWIILVEYYGTTIFHYSSYRLMASPTKINVSVMFQFFYQTEYALKRRKNVAKGFISYLLT